MDSLLNIGGFNNNIEMDVGLVQIITKEMYFFNSKICSKLFLKECLAPLPSPETMPTSGCLRLVYKYRVRYCLL